MTQCQRCSTLPASPPDVGTLCLAPPQAHTVATLRNFLDQRGIVYVQSAANVLNVELAPGVLRRLADGIGCVLSEVELRDTRSLIVGDASALSLADLASTLPLSTLVARAQGEWFTEMLKESRLTSHFQPIVHATRPNDVFAYECLLRGVNTDGQLVAPHRLYEAARITDLMSPLDRAARLTAIRSGVLHGLDASGSLLFINFNPTSIYNPLYCLRSTVAAISESMLRPERIVFEIVESDRVADDQHLVRIVDYYRAAGFRVALDDLGSGYGSLNLLGKLKPDFVKLDIQLIRGVDQDAYKAGIASAILGMAQKLDVATVAEGIETEGEWNWACEHGADYVQGYLIARPASMPPSPQFRASPKFSDADTFALKR